MDTRIEEQSIIIETKKRHFGGKIKDFADKQEQSYEKKHLKAYLKGYQKFRDGFYTDSYGSRQISWFNVIEEWR